MHAFYSPRPASIGDQDERNRAIQKCILHRCLLRVLPGLSRPVKRVSFALLSSRVRRIEPVFKDKAESDPGTLLFQMCNCVNIRVCIRAPRKQQKGRFRGRCFLSFLILVSQVSRKRAKETNRFPTLLFFFFFFFFFFFLLL